MAYPTYMRKPIIMDLRRNILAYQLLALSTPMTAFKNGFLDPKPVLSGANTLENKIITIIWQRELA